MSNKHTPGPWKVADYQNCLAIECEINGIGHTVVMDQFCYPNFAQNGSDEKLANARLIAAAPEMFELLKRCVPEIHVDNLWNEIKSTITNIDPTWRP